MYSKIKVILALFLCMGFAQAENITYGVYDINTQQPIESVSIDVKGNHTLPLNTSTTNSDGLTNIYLNETLTYYIVTYTKIGYFPVTINRTYDPVDNDIYFMTPITQDGIIRLRINDINLNDHDFCLFFTENGRLDECYTANSNETITILVNKEYTIKPMITKYDVVSSSNNIKNYGYIFAGLIVAISVALGLISIFIGILYKIIRK